MLKKVLPSLLALCAGMAVTPVQASDFLWSDTYLSYRFLWQDKQPGSPKNTKENAVNLSHADAWAYGSNFFSLDVEQFSHQDPSNSASGATSPNSTGSGEFYGLFRSTFSGNKIFATKAFAFGPIKDVGLEIGADWCTQNDQFASNKKMIVVGPQFAIDLPKGFWDVSLHVAHEWNTNAYHSFTANGDGSDNFDMVPELETAWLVPFNLGPVPLKFTGYANVIGPKKQGKFTGQQAYQRISGASQADGRRRRAGGRRSRQDRRRCRLRILAEQVRQPQAARGHRAERRFLRSGLSLQLIASGGVTFGSPRRLLACQDIK